MTAPVRLARLKQRAADAAAREPRVDRERIDSHRPRVLAQRDERVARQFAVYGRGDHRSMLGAQEFAQRPARYPVGVEQLVFEPRNRIEIPRTSLAHDEAAMAPVAHVGKNRLPLLRRPASDRLWRLYRKTQNRPTPLRRARVRLVLWSDAEELACLRMSDTAALAPGGRPMPLKALGSRTYARRLRVKGG